jgi:Flp pilus assembly protein TadB
VFMPYKDTERKRQWEQEHREQRNARRRMQRLAARSGQPNVPRPAPNPVSKARPQTAGKSLAELVRLRKKCLALRTPDPRSAQKPGSGWEVIIAVAVGIGVVLLAACGWGERSFGFGSE